MKTPSRAPLRPLGAQAQRGRAQVRVLAHARVERVVEQHPPDRSRRPVAYRVGMSEFDRVGALAMRHLVAFETVAEERSFTRAARRLGYTQSAVSHQMATLERLVGKQLIERPRGSEAANLTEAGEILHRHARALISRVKLAYDDLDGLAEGVERHVPVRHLPEREHEHPAARPAAVRAAVPARARAPHGVRRGPLARARPRGGQARRVVRDAAAARGAARRRSSCCAIRSCCSSRPTRPSPARAAAPSLAEIAQLPLIAWKSWHGRRGHRARARLRAQRDHALRRQRHGALAGGAPASARRSCRG